MRCNLPFAALLALAVPTYVLGQIDPTPDFDPVRRPARNEVVAAGSTFDIAWQADTHRDGNISIALIGGKSPATLQPLMKIATSVKNSNERYSWTVDPKLGTDKIYGVVLTLEGSAGKTLQYSDPFTIKRTVNDVVAAETTSATSSRLPASSALPTSDFGDASGQSASSNRQIEQDSTAVMTAVESSVPPTTTSSASSSSFSLSPSITFATSTTLATVPTVTRTKAMSVPTQKQASGASAYAMSASGLIITVALQLWLA